MKTYSYIKIMFFLLLSSFLNDVSFLEFSIPFLSIKSMHPDFVIIFIIFISFRLSKLAIIWIAFTLGILQDASNWIPIIGGTSFISLLGIHSLVYIAIAYSTYQLRDFFSLEQIGFLMGLTFVLTLIERTAVLLLESFFFDSYNKNYSILLPAIYTALFSFLWYRLLNMNHSYREETR